MIEALPPGAVPVVSMAFGSPVYGTALPTSDRDLKGDFLPPARDILLQRAAGTISRGTKEDPSRPNTAGDVDVELFSLQRYMELLLQGQTNALDMLFTPEEHYLERPSAVWKELRRERGRFLHSGVSMFARYCRQQAAKYGIKGSRVAAVRAALAALEKLDAHSKLEDGKAGLAALVASAGAETARHLKLVEHGQPGNVYLEVAGRKVPLGATVKLARQTLQRLFEEFGQRALQAEKNQGVDWKALMHAVRVAGEARELLLTGSITFPRPDRELLLRIRKGELPYERVAELIESGIEDLEAAVAVSKLPAEPDRAFAEDFVSRHYAAHVRKG